MGMVAGSMGSMRPLLLKLVHHINSLRQIPIAISSGEEGSGGPNINFQWRVRGAASRVQGDSVLQTGIPGEDPESCRGRPSREVAAEKQ